MAPGSGIQTQCWLLAWCGLSLAFVVIWGVTSGQTMSLCVLNTSF